MHSSLAIRREDGFRLVGFTEVNRKMPSPAGTLSYFVDYTHVSTTGNGEGLVATVTPAATKEQFRRAYDIKFNCLTKANACSRLSDLMPSAWSDFVGTQGSGRMPTSGGPWAVSLSMTRIGPVPRQNFVRMKDRATQGTSPREQNYLTIGRALERLGVSRGLNCGQASSQIKSVCPVLVLIIRQLGCSDGASRPGALETRPHPDPWTELCPPAFPFLSPGACGLHGNSEHSPIAGA